MADPAPNKLQTCPYNKSHVVEQYRMHIHLLKCRKQYLDCQKITCPFDATHIVNEVEMEHHVSVCPKRYMLDERMYVMDNDFRPVVEVATPTSDVPCDEDWETVNTSSYVPDSSKRGNHIITKVKGATPSERRKARMQGIATYRPKE